MTHESPRTGAELPIPGARRGRARIIVPLLLMALIWFESGRALPIDLAHQSDKLVHALAFGVLALSWFWALGPLAGSLVKVAVAAALVAVLWGAIDEWHQSYVPSRTCDVFDALADAGGAATAVVAAAWIAGRARTTGSRT